MLSGKGTDLSAVMYPVSNHLARKHLTFVFGLNHSGNMCIQCLTVLNLWFI